MLRTMEVTSFALKACTIVSGAAATRSPGALTNMSTGMRPAAEPMLTPMPRTSQLMPRPMAGIGVARTEAVGDWNSSSASGGTSGVVLLTWREDGFLRDWFWFMNVFLRREMPVLLEPEMAVDGAAFDQFAVGADIHGPALVQHHDQVAIEQGGEPVRDDYHGAPLGDAQQVGIHQSFGFRIERAGGFVEDQHPRIGHQRAGDGEALLLPAGEVRRAFLDERVITIGQPFDELFRTGQPARLHRVLEGQARPSREDIVPHRAAEQKIILQHHAEILAQMPQ